MSDAGDVASARDAGTSPSSSSIEVELAFSPGPREIDVVRLVLPAGARLVDALRAGPWPVVQRLPEAVPGSEAAAWTVGVWGRVQPLDHALRANDRVEVFRPLAVDPKEARRDRFDRAGGVRELRRRQRALRERTDDPAA